MDSGPLPHYVPLLGKPSPRTFPMIRHIVFFSLTAPEHAEAVHAGLMVLSGIPEAKRFEVARNLRVDALSAEVDFVVYAEFDDEAALARYKAHPLYEEAIRKVRPLRDVRIAADVEAGG